jgi:hypothetical protein
MRNGSPSVGDAVCAGASKLPRLYGDKSCGDTRYGPPPMSAEPISTLTFVWGPRCVVSDTLPTTDLLRALAGVLRVLPARWYVFGAQAVLVWGRPRLTGDVDVTMFPDREDSDAFVTAMARAGFDLRVANVHDFVARTRVFPFTHVVSGLALDVVLGGPGLEEEFLRTARQVDIGGVTVPVIGPEELIVTKVLASRSKDLDDVRGILVAQAEALDLQRIRDLLRAIESAIDQSDLSPCFEEQVRLVRGR